MSESNLVRTKNRYPNPDFKTRFQNKHFLEFPNVVRLCQVMITTPANNSLLERS